MGLGSLKNAGLQWEEANLPSELWPTCDESVNKGTNQLISDTAKSHEENKAR